MGVVLLVVIFNLTITQDHGFHLHSFCFCKQTSILDEIHFLSTVKREECDNEIKPFLVNTDKI